jgi:hypothetical protein
MSSWLSKTIRPDNAVTSEFGHGEAEDDAAVEDEGLAASTEADGLGPTGADVTAGRAGLGLDPHPPVRAITAIAVTHRHGTPRRRLLLMTLLHAAREGGSGSSQRIGPDDLPQPRLSSRSE